MQNTSEIYLAELQNRIGILQQTNCLYEEKLQTSQEIIRISEEKLKALEEENKYLEFQLAQMKRMIFGAKRERFISNATVNQLTLPFECATTPAFEKPSEREQITYTREKSKRVNHPGRLEFPSHLPVFEIYIEPKENTGGLKCIGQEITTELDYEPAKLFLRKYIRNKYALPGGEGILIGELPIRVIEKGIPGPGLLANIMVEKFVDHLPYYRQNERYKREGVNIPLSTIDSWFTQISDLITPLYECLARLVLRQGYIQCDESPVRVLDRNKKGKTHQGYQWVYNAPLIQTVLYHYQMSRGREGPMKLLKNFMGYLQTDGYSVYEWFARLPGITHVGCMAHVRRYFEKALSYDREKAGQVMLRIQNLYAIERKAREAAMSQEQRKELRLSESLPMMNELGKLIIEMNKTAIPKSPMGIALDYATKRWDTLLSYLHDGSLEIDNNLVENAIRPNALGRKNYLFAGSHDAAQRAAMFYSFFATCKLNNVNPYQWLKKVLEIIPDYPANKLKDLLPQNLKL